MSVMHMKSFQVILERGGDGWYIAEVPTLPGCHTQGRTKKEALKNITEAIELYLEVMKEQKAKAKTGSISIEKVSVHA